MREGFTSGSKTRPALSFAIALAACTAAPREVAPRPTAAPPAPSSAPVPPPKSPGLHFDIGAIDKTKDPCQSFYDYACGGWRASHPIPADQAKWDRYAEMRAVNTDRVRALVEEARAPGGEKSAAEKRVGAYFAACMDTAEIDRRSVEPLRDIYRSIRKIRTAKDVTPVLVDMHAHGVEGGFSLSAGTAVRDSQTMLAWLDKGALGMPDPSDYTSSEPAAVERRSRYVAHLQRLFGLLGEGDTDRRAQGVLRFETALAEASLSRAERRQRDKQDHQTTLDELTKSYPSIDWRSYFDAIGLTGIKVVNVAQPRYFAALDKALRAKDLAGLRDHLEMMVARSQSRTLAGPIEAEVFDFAQRTLRGKKEMATREKRCLQLVDEDVGVDLGQMFLSRHYGPEARARMATMIAHLLDAYRADIAAADWLSPQARGEARAKLDAGLVVTGASNRPRSLEALVIDPKDAFGNGWRSQALYVRDELARIGVPVDRERFFEPLPQELDGFGSKSMNATGFTAGFLQPPLLDPEMDDAVNYGGLGSVIGHELSHQLDDEGRKYDARGTQRDWWSAEDVARYEERAKCFADEYSAFKLEDGTPIDGRLTLGENIADNGGIRLSFAASRPSFEGPAVEGFSPAQRFFLAWAQIRCENVTPEYAQRLAKTNEHAPGRFRVDGVVSNMPEFARAFSCRASTPMAPAKRCTLW